MENGVNPNYKEAEIKAGNDDDPERSKLGELLRERDQLDSLKYDGMFANPEIRKFFLDRMGTIIENCYADGMEEIVFLDKSARLLGGFFRKVWEVKYPDEEIPSVSFMNIGCEKMRSHEVRADQYLENMDDETFEREMSDMITQLKESFGEKFENKQILIIDEMRCEGRALNYAYQMMAHAYPRSKIFATWFSNNWFEKGEVFDRKVGEKISEYAPPASSEPNIYIGLIQDYENGVIEGPDPRALLAMPWQHQEFAGETEDEKAAAKKEYMTKIRHWHDQMTKLALELL